jgi:aldehyde dehydrogenase
MLHQVIESLKARIALRPRYDNYIGGKWVAPAEGRYFDNISPITGRPICQIARSQAADVELALDAAHAAKDKWAATAPAQRAAVLYKIADRIDENRDCWPRSRPSTTASRSASTRAADIPLAADHFRYFAACLRAQEGSLSEKRRSGSSRRGDG